MEKLLTDISGCNISEEINLLSNSIISSVTSNGISRTKKSETLVSRVKYLSKINDIESDISGICFGFNNMRLNDELSDKKVRDIAYQLARAVDENSVEKVKQLKKEFGQEKEFVIARKFLDKQCKEIWNVFETKKKNLKIPYQAMKALGITNQPTLDFLLGNSVRYYEKDGTASTANIIANILNNDNMNYEMNKIHEYLKSVHEKEKCKYNFKTVSYLISEQNYNLANLSDLGVEVNLLNKVFNSLLLKNKLKFLFNNPSYFKFLLK